MASSGGPAFQQAHVNTMASNVSRYDNVNEPTHSSAMTSSGGPAFQQAQVKTMTSNGVNNEREERGAKGVLPAAASSEPENIQSVASRIEALQRVNERMVPRRTWEYVSAQPWCHYDATEADATRFLQDKPVGAFMVIGQPYLALALRVAHKVVHLPINIQMAHDTAPSYQLCSSGDESVSNYEPYHSNLDALIDHYQYSANVQGVALLENPPIFVKRVNVPSS